MDVDARNRIEEQGDLELRSAARASVVASWWPAPRHDLEVPPLLPPSAVALILAERGVPEASTEDVLRVERRWVSDDLPDLELLDACAHAYVVLDAMVAAAEAVCSDGVEPGVIAPAGSRPTCMVVGPEARTAYLHLEAGQIVGAGRIVRAQRTTLPLHHDEEARARERYGVEPMRPRGVSAQSPAPARGYSAEEVRQLLEVVPDTVQDRRDRAILLTFVLTGP